MEDSQCYDDLKIVLKLSSNGWKGKKIDTFNYLRKHSLTIRNTYRCVFIKEPLSYSGTNSKRQREALDKIRLTLEQNALE